MADQQDLRGSNLEKDPADWKTGDEPMTGAQASYLKTLSDQASEPFDDGLTKAEASRRIDELQERTGRGQSWPHAAPSRYQAATEGSGGGQEADAGEGEDDTGVLAARQAFAEKPAGQDDGGDRVQRPEHADHGQVAGGRGVGEEEIRPGVAQADQRHRPDPAARPAQGPGRPPADERDH